MLINVIQDSFYVKKINEESIENTKQADIYLQTQVEDMFPEITKAIQQRRAQYYLLIHEYKYVEKMLKHGQIEQREADTFNDQINKKLFYLNTHAPKIELMDHRSGIINI